MNNTIGMNRKVNDRRVAAKSAPAWLIMLAHIILFVTKEENALIIKCGAALAVVILTAMFAGGISCGVVPLTEGVLICGALIAVAMLLTRDLA